jgi:predicted ATPase
MIQLLASRGYAIVPEAARMIIEEEQLAQSTALPWADLRAFQDRVVERQLELEGSVTTDAFADRSIVDGYAYSRYGGIEPPPLIAAHAPGRYAKVFLLDPLPHYINDAQRWETQEFRAAIQPLIEAAYREFGYHPIAVPVLPPEERVECILSRLQD